MYFQESIYYNFVQGLEWLQPDNSKSYFSIDCEFRPHIPPHLKKDKSSIWLYRSLENHSLSQKLSWLLSDKTHVSACYQSYAFLCQESYAEATLICLRAVERNQPSLLSEINPYLFLQKNKESHKIHRRCSSFPDNHMKKIFEENKHKRSVTLQDLTVSSQCKKISIQGKLKPWRSMPSLQVSTYLKPKIRTYSQSKTTPSTPVHTKKVDKISPSALKVRS